MLSTPNCLLKHFVFHFNYIIFINNINVIILHLTVQLTHLAHWLTWAYPYIAKTLYGNLITERNADYNCNTQINDIYLNYEL